MRFTVINGWRVDRATTPASPMLCRSDLYPWLLTGDLCF